MFVTQELSFQNIEFSEQEDFFSFFDLFRNILSLFYCIYASDLRQHLPSHDSILRECLI